MKKTIFLLVGLVLLLPPSRAQVYVQILGTAQDGGYPHIGCTRACCTRAIEHPELSSYVVSFALVDSAGGRWWLFEATPDMKEQLRYFRTLTGGRYSYLPTGIFITHAHIGHYLGLAQLGREALGAKDVPVFVLPRLKTYLQNNGPWSQLVRLGNISLRDLQLNSITGLAEHITVRAFAVPHRDEFSETAGFEILTPGKKYLFIPDIDKWQKWDRNIIAEVTHADVAMLDATFFDGSELPGRRMEEVPHPFVSETLQLFSDAPPETKEKIYFIHFNHTNPLLRDEIARQKVTGAGFRLAGQGMKL